MRTFWQVGEQILGRWEIFKILEGGAGIVYIVYDHAFHEPFAAKTFRDEIFARSPQIAERFMQEALAWVRLDAHPNVAQARMLENINGKPFLFLEYVSGGDLGSWIGTPRLTEDLPQILRFAIQFCDGMIHAVGKGIRAHRDIKPRNCLITRENGLKVTDFGLAKLVDDDLYAGSSAPMGTISRANLTVAAVGTCTHMAPEQFENATQVDLRADVYSFGVMLYQMVRGELPFLGQTWQELEHLHKTFPAPIVTGTDPRLAYLIRLCLSKKPEGRPADFQKVRALLSEIYQSVEGTPPPEPAVGTSLTAGDWSNKGSSLEKLGRFPEAIACYNRALQLDPRLDSAWFNKGVGLFASGLVNEAIECYEQALRLNPKAEQAWSNKGVVLKSLGKTEEAIGCYDRALQLNPRYPNAWVNKGVVLKAMGRTADALTCYERALRLKPDDEMAWTNKGNLFYAQCRAQEAIGCYDRALKINSGLALTWLNKGIALSSLAKHAEALQCFDRALEIEPGLAQAWMLRGSTLVNGFHQFQEAIPYFEQAERLGSAEAKQALAVCQNAAVKR
jgi:tetratricopeptide (TPR) repeat protein